VFATSETPDNPAFEKSKLANLMSWRSSRIAAAKMFSTKKVELPIYPAYEVEKTKWGGGGGDRGDLIAEAMKDPGFAKEWKGALAAAAALEGNLASMARAQLAPKSQARLVEVDGLQIPSVDEVGSDFGPFFENDAIRLPLLGLVSAMFADQLRVLDVKHGQTIDQFEESQKGCGADVAWVSRDQPKEGGPARVAAIAIGRCEKLEGRGGSYLARTVELMVYDATGRLALVVGNGHVEGYRWTTDGGKPMLAGGRSLTSDGFILDAKRRQAVATK
jgi:hypothetical protein